MISLLLNALLLIILSCDFIVSLVSTFIYARPYLQLFMCFSFKWRQ